ncbi:MAG: radical SAM protein [Promethearchaeota archaeon]
MTELQNWLHAPFTELGPLFQAARNITNQNFNQQVKLYFPGKRFPSISVTGRSCQLDCQHCGGKFLQHMNPITEPSTLLSFCQKLAANQGIGCLISGGCDSKGQVPLSPFYKVLTEIKNTTELFLNVHTGFLTAPEAKQLAETGIDCASVDVVGDDKILHHIYGLTNRSTQDYAETLQALANAGISVAPHICVGLQFGHLSGELEALQLIHSIIKPSTLVIIALMPTKGTKMADLAPPTNIDIARICALARLIFPETEIALGCMRPHGSIRREMERMAIEAGITRLAVPAQSTQKYLEKKGYKIEVKQSCCVFS